jgi:hypothetical protein
MNVASCLDMRDDALFAVWLDLGASRAHFRRFSSILGDSGERFSSDSSLIISVIVTTTLSIFERNSPGLDWSDEPEAIAVMTSGLYSVDDLTQLQAGMRPSSGSA